MRTRARAHTTQTRSTHTHAHAQKHTCADTHVRAHVHTTTPTHTHAYIHTQAHRLGNEHAHARAHTHTRARTCVRTQPRTPRPRTAARAKGMCVTLVCLRATLFVCLFVCAASRSARGPLVAAQSMRLPPAAAGRTLRAARRRAARTAAASREPLSACAVAAQCRLRCEQHGQRSESPDGAGGRRSGASANVASRAGGGRCARSCAHGACAELSGAREWLSHDAPSCMMYANVSTRLPARTSP
jgi:hypothetical protein